MDQELVQYLDQRFGRIDEQFGQTDARFDRIDERFGQIDDRFGRIEQRLDGHDRRFDSIEQRLDVHNGRFEAIERRFDDVNERIRHNGVLIEGVRHELHLVADGLLMHIEARHREDREYFDSKFEAMAALLRSSYDHLQQQQEQLRESQDQSRQRIENLERNRPN